MQTEPAARRLDAVVALLERHGQEHLLVGLDRADDPRVASFVVQVEAIDFDEIASLADPGGGHPDLDPGSIEPAPVVPRHPEDESTHREAGEQLIRDGGVAAFTVAGGQGTRLGWNGPKGTFPATPITGKPLFRVFAEQLTAVDRRYGVETPWYLMTSPLNDEATRSFFVDNNFFGRNPDSILMFPQGVMPAVDDRGRLMLAEPGVLAVSPDGHGGSLRALHRSGALEHARSRGVRHLSYFQVDKPTVRTIDPLFLGLHVGHPESSGEMSSKMVPKVNAGEKVGVFCRVGGRTRVIEYSDLPAHLAEATDRDGRLRFISGSIAIHVLAVDFVERLTDPQSEARLPFHRARKKVPFWNPDSGDRVEPGEPNATKFEMFVFDALHFARAGLVYETVRVAVSAPIKNAEGTDSAVSSGVLQTERAARWMEGAGAKIPRTDDGTVDGRIEIVAATALEAGDLEGRGLPGMTAGEDVVL
ncbi:MAG: UTP--glucose-1-phosphate uridylyltransferase [Planctomycetota bacterium]|nr:UTP--glucose-1-phosphate uridylyltransferase [Planctomycetota bacterium]